MEGDKRLFGEVLKVEGEGEARVLGELLVGVWLSDVFRFP
jgi:hypothetical protein